MTATTKKNIKVKTKRPTDINKIKVETSKLKTVVLDIADGGEF